MMDHYQKNENNSKRITRSISRKIEHEAERKGQHPHSLEYTCNENHPQHNVYLDKDGDVIMTDRDECIYCTNPSNVFVTHCYKE
jgi:NAD-dependent dihydropyrimidine dehydrogenase PreA subunit